MTSKTKRPVVAACSKCERVLNQGEEVWGEDWKVCDAPDWKWRWETRYICDDCHKAGAA